VKCYFLWKKNETEKMPFYIFVLWEQPYRNLSFIKILYLNQFCVVILHWHMVTGMLFMNKQSHVCLDSYKCTVYELYI